MKLFHIASLLTATLFSVAISATPITWNNIPYPNTPVPSFNPPAISFTPIGPNTYGSDGSSAYTSGDTTVTNKGVTIQSYGDGSRAVDSTGVLYHRIGETVYIQHPDGKKEVCNPVAGRIICR